MPRRFGTALPALLTEVPGPASRALAARLAAVESRNVTRISDAGPIFWAEARGANVRDADGNVYVDLTAGFAVTAAGHGNRRVARAVARQAARLGHALGDVHPADIKVRLLERLAELAPGALEVSVLANSGAEAVEAALKTAMLVTGRPGVLAFEGAYHGLTYGALAATHRPDFREPFRAQVFGGVRFAPFPSVDGDGAGPVRRAGRSGAAGGSRARLAPAGSVAIAPDAEAAMRAVLARLAEADAAGVPVGAVLVEPVQGRGGIRVAAPGFLAGLRRLCDDRGLVLIFDEVYCGFGRTGRMFACQHFDVEPDILVVGKALSGVLPISAAIGTRAVMDAWPESSGEAIHTSTFLGNPVACAAAIAHLDEIERRGLVRRAERRARQALRRLRRWPGRVGAVREIRGLGLMLGIVLEDGRRPGRPGATLASDVADAALRRGVLLLAEGPDADVLAVTPPLTITARQLDRALDILEALLVELEAAGP